MKRAGVIGHPISHSKSPLIHAHWLTENKIEGEYRAYDIAPENLRDEVLRLRDTGLSGINVTLPHKQAIMDICTTINDEAQKIGAVNTVVFYPSGEIEGRNTDAYGFITNAKETYPDFQFGNSSALVLGAGGAARSVLYALKREGVSDIRISNRTIENAEELAEEFGATVYDWDEKEKALKGAGLVVNTTSLGMSGKPHLRLDLSDLSPEALVYDIVYAPLITELLGGAQNKGCRIVTGIGMLLHQARPAFQAFYGTLPEVTDALRGKVLR
ncbi:MAG: shikimate dehydrogenase [Micavibrio aeruginosavorus]|uniref:Shikimate dehydrogenase (NADP(+)) n=1 Tax=Micavibrio aeruginosavorus TaxID=349221 RepID=A0A2W5FQR4_9BACT|nr:MAG: shikimate dehydrogenase [Micavibrio aeruginosavorus]